MSESKSSRQKSWLSIGLIVILCVVNLLLIKQNLDLRKQLRAGARTLDLTNNFLQPGDVVKPVTATELDGRPYQLDYNKDGDTVYYYSSRPIARTAGSSHPFGVTCLISWTVTASQLSAL